MLDQRAHINSAITELESLIEDVPNEPRYRHLLAICLRELAPEFFSHKSPPAQAAESRSIDILQQLVADFPDRPEYRLALCQVLGRIDTQHSRSIDPDDEEAAEQQLRESLKHAAQLVIEHPHVPDYILAQIHISSRLAQLLERRARQSDLQLHRQRMQNALEAWRVSARLMESLVRRFPNAQGYQSWLERFRKSESHILTRRSQHSLINE